MLELLDLRGVPRPEIHSRLPRPPGMEDLPFDAVAEILGSVKRGGDASLIELTERFDGVGISTVRVDPDHVRGAPGRIPKALREALEAAHSSIEGYHRHTVVAVPDYSDRGIEVAEIRRPVRRAGCYVPGGRARYPSSVLMTATPAKVAGVAEVVLCTPPGPDGEVDGATLAAAAIAGVDEVYRIGGAQAIAAMAYGTESIAPVDVIAGPGNVFVSVAQRLVAGTVGVPSSFAGPSEVVVVADSTTNVREAALDVVVQAEHGPNGLAWLVTWDEATARAVMAEVASVVDASPRKADISATLAKGGYAVLVDDAQAAMVVSDAVAPEHLELMCEDPASLVGLVNNAGAVFCGPWSPASVGDYIAGPSHVLPTYGSARFASVLGVDDFCRRIHAITVSKDALARVGPSVEEIADAEGLDTHKLSVSERLAR